MKVAESKVIPDIGDDIKNTFVSVCVKKQTVSFVGKKIMAHWSHGHHVTIPSAGCS